MGSSSALDANALAAAYSEPILLGTIINVTMYGDVYSTAASILLSLSEVHFLVRLYSVVMVMDSSVPFFA
jgi:hypothetical protein